MEARHGEKVYSRKTTYQGRSECRRKSAANRKSVSCTDQINGWAHLMRARFS